MVANDHARETREDMHAAEEAVAAAVKRMDDALYAFHTASVNTVNVEAAGLTRALIAQNAAYQALVKAEHAYDDAICDRDRIGGRA